MTKGRRIIFAAAAAVAAVAVIAAAVIAYRAGAGGAAGRAEEIASSVFSCSAQQAQELYAALDSSRQSADAIGGISSGDTDALTSLLAGRCGGYLTDAAIEQCMANRIFTNVAAIAQEYATDVTAEKITAEKREGEADAYNFTAVLMAGGVEAATVEGVIVLDEGDPARADSLTATLKTAAYHLNG